MSVRRTRRDGGLRQQTGTSPTMASDYLPGSNGWSGMDGAGGGLDWLLDPWKGTGYTLSLGVPIIPTNSSGSAVATLAQGATGAYNSYFVTLAQTLVGGGQANAYLRLGWEFDGGWDAWSATTASAEASYAAYFQQIVTAMRSVPGAAVPLRVESRRVGLQRIRATRSRRPIRATPTSTSSASMPTTSRGRRRRRQPTPGPRRSCPTSRTPQQFASSHGKPLAFPEWGVAIRDDGHGLGDDPNYINQMVAWMHNPSNDVVYESYFDDDSGGVNSQITGGSFPNSLAAFSADLG